MSLELDKAEWLKDTLDGSSSLKAFLALAGESISEKESKRFEEGWLKDILDGSSSLKAFLALAGESISETESKGFEE